MNFRLFSVLLVAIVTPGCRQPEQQAVPAVSSASEERPVAAPPATGFEGERAFAHVRAQVDLGPRPAGSAALEKTRSYLLTQLRSYGLKPRLDEFAPLTPKGRVKMKNIIVDIRGRQPESIIIASHYDTKEFRDFRFVGANDGGSSTGVLLEIARVLAADKSDRRLTIQLVFFDGEEAFCREWSECLEGSDNTYGSRHMAEQISRDGKAGLYKAMILLDMVGDRSLAIPREENSSPWLVDAIWQTARELGFQRHFPGTTHWMTDDHLPFLKAGIPAVDLIDFDYGDETGSFWHTSQDTLDKIDPRSLQVVGDVVLRSLPRIEATVRP
ncbi:MAG: M28 family peptidase [Acidobacteria bacterium]|nr:M28 family peptidase [Acidobacteriota bacterium]